LSGIIFHRLVVLLKTQFYFSI